MAANKFATMVNNNTNKITLILVYAILEWMLIILLILNSIFCYLIIKFAEFFGLNAPCFSCARIDRFRYHLCEFHSKEISNLGFCSHHKKVAAFDDLCENCGSSVLGFRRKSTNFVFSKVERVDVVEIDEEVNLKCSCCGVDFHKKIVDDSCCFVVHPLWDGTDNVDKENRVVDCGENVFSGGPVESGYVELNQEIVSEKHSDFETEDLHLNSFEKDFNQVEKGEDLHSQDLKFFGDYSGDQLFPFELLDLKTEQKIEQYDQDCELIDLKTEESRREFEDEDHEFGEFQKANLNSEKSDDLVPQKTEDLSKFVENLIDFGDEEVVISQEKQTPLTETNELQDGDSDIHSVRDEDDVSIGAEIPVLDSNGEIKLEEGHSINYSNFNSDLEKEAREDENVDEIEEERAPETPSSHHSRNPLHKKWLMHETKELGVEESFDGSVISETDGGDPVSTSEKLKLALKAERKALQDLYSELEEERNASMVATSETMAMINRLQEEKAAMQMEALQYQRMMEEQAEYDQEALQLLNELMTKKEKELELYRKKVLDYESKEKSRVARMSTKTRSSSISWSHSEDEDMLSVDSVQVPKDEYTLNGIQSQHTPVDAVLDLESSLANFEEERVSILEQLRVLEEKLVALSGEEDQHFAKTSIIEDHYEEIDPFGFNRQNTESTINGFGENGKQPLGERILPLFDAISNANEDGVTVRNGYENGFYSTKFDYTAATRFELEKKRIDMEEEVDQLYGRLQALEADREFLKHCIGSMKKGDKGMELLTEILHHLKDLRDVNLRAKSYTENALL